MTTIDPAADGDCEQFLLVRDRAANATAMVAVHDTRLGPAHGGIRRRASASPNEAPADAAAPHVLHRRGVPVVPDFVANAGALIAGVTWNRERRRVGAERLQRIGTVAGELLDRARAEDVPPSLLALQVASERVERGA
jgi:glutamate dehydrogenase/leucine dehydrogenase